MIETYVPSFSIEVAGETLVHGSTVDIMSVSVTETSERADMFSIALRDRHQESGSFAGGDDLKWMDNDTFQEGNAVKIEMGYVDNMRLMIEGNITAVTPSFPESGMPSLSIRGASRYDKLMRDCRREPFTKNTDSAIAEEAANQAGLKAQVDATNIEYPYHSGGDESLHQVLTERAERINYEVVVKKDTLIFSQPGYRKNPSPVLVLEWGRNLKSFRPSMKTHGLLTEVTVRGSQTSQGGKKTPIVGTAAAGEERVKLGDKSGSEYVADRLAGCSKLYRDHNIQIQEEAREVALAQLEKSSMEYITGRGSCIGTVELEPRHVIEIKNIGKRFSGKYYVTKVTHTIDSAGYRSDFEVKRNAR